MRDRLPRSALRRGLRLAGLPAAHAGRTAVGLGKRLGGRSAELVAAEVQERSAAQLFRVLGELKGGAMKLGQALSAMEAALPAELARPYRDALTQLVETAPPVPTSVVHAVLADSLGSDWRDRFVSFEDRPTAAASLGQVHRATWHDGTAVAVKVQYPRIAEALSADLRHLERVAPLIRVGVPNVDSRALLAHLHDRLLEELDYRHEAATQRAFVEAFAGDADFVVPAVVEATESVLVSEWLEGRPLVDIMNRGTTNQRDEAGTRLLRLLLSSPARVGHIHGDPHPGNFHLAADGRLVIYDFGSSEPMSDGWPSPLGRLLRAGRDRDAAQLHAEAVAANLVAPSDVTPESLLEVLDPWFTPFRVTRFHFDRTWLRDQSRTWSNPRSTAARLLRKVHIPAHHLLVQRVGFGLVGVLTALDATVEVRVESEKWIRGLA